MSEAKTSVTERIRIEDMTLGEIKEAKSLLSDRIQKAIRNEIELFSEKYDWGSIAVGVETDIWHIGYEGHYLNKRNIPRHVTQTITVKSDLEEDE